MRVLKKHWIKILAISAICAVIDMVTHILWAPLYSYSPPSFFVKNNLFKPMAALILFFTYVLLGIVFIYIQDNLYGSKIKKGMLYGISFGGLWLVGMPGVSLLFNSPLKQEIITGILDCLTIIILGWLLGKFVAEDNPDSKSQSANLSAILVIGFFYFAGRYLAYILFHVEIAYATKFTDTLMWTLFLGIWIGIMYVLLRPCVEKYSSLKKALLYGGVILGIDWLLFNFFAILFLEVSPLELFVQAGTDILLIVIGIFVYEYFKKNIGPA